MVFLPFLRINHPYPEEILKISPMWGWVWSFWSNDQSHPRTIILEDSSLGNGRGEAILTNWSIDQKITPHQPSRRGSSPNETGRGGFLINWSFDQKHPTPTSSRGVLWWGGWVGVVLLIWSLIKLIKSAPSQPPRKRSFPKEVGVGGFWSILIKWSSAPWESQFSGGGVFRPLERLPRRG